MPFRLIFSASPAVHRPRSSMRAPALESSVTRPVHLVSPISMSTGSETGIRRLLLRSKGTSGSISNRGAFNIPDVYRPAREDDLDGTGKGNFTSVAHRPWQLIIDRQRLTVDDPGPPRTDTDCAACWILSRWRHLFLVTRAFARLPMPHQHLCPVAGTGSGQNPGMPQGEAHMLLDALDALSDSFRHAM